MSVGDGTLPGMVGHLSLQVWVVLHDLGDQILHVANGLQDHGKRHRMSHLPWNQSLASLTPSCCDPWEAPSYRNLRTVVHSSETPVDEA